MAKKSDKSKPAPERIIRSVIMPPDVDARMVEAAKLEQRPITFVIVRAVREWLDRADKPAKS